MSNEKLMNIVNEIWDLAYEIEHDMKELKRIQEYFEYYNKMFSKTYDNLKAHKCALDDMLDTFQEEWY